MARSTNAPASRARRKKRLHLARGFYGGRSRLFRTATESVDRAQKMAYVHRKDKKRDYRAMWVIRLGAACEEIGYSYSNLIGGLAKAGVTLNRKMLSEIALHDREGFASIVKLAQAQKA